MAKRKVVWSKQLRITAPEKTDDELVEILAQYLEHDMQAVINYATSVISQHKTLKLEYECSDGVVR